MSDAPGDERFSPFESGFVVPIAGLLSLIFAVMAGASVGFALNGSTELFGLPIIFGAASLFFFYVRKQRLDAMEE